MARLHRAADGTLKVQDRNGRMAGTVPAGKNRVPTAATSTATTTPGTPGTPAPSVTETYQKFLETASAEALRDILITGTHDVTKIPRSRIASDLDDLIAEGYRYDQLVKGTRLLDRCRQQLLVRRAPGIVQLDAPGSHADRYELDPDGRPSRVWYASYGSNMLSSRFACYITGGSAEGSSRENPGARDKTLPEETVPVALPGTVHFAGSSITWGGSGVAFFDPCSHGQSLGRAYRISAEQFDDVVAQESGLAPGTSKVDLTAAIRDRVVVGRGLYGTLVHVGDYDGAPVFTFTGPFTTAGARSRQYEIGAEGKLVESGTTRKQNEAAKAEARRQIIPRLLRFKKPYVRPEHHSRWRVFSNAPSEAYLSMLGEGLKETFGMSDVQFNKYVAGLTGYVRPEKPKLDQPAK